MEKRTGTPFRLPKKEPERRSGAFRSHCNPDCHTTDTRQVTVTSVDGVDGDAKQTVK